MGNFDANELHRIVLEVRGPKTTKEVKRYMRRVRSLLRQLPGNVKDQAVVRSGAKRKPKKQKPRRRKPAKRRRRPR